MSQKQGCSGASTSFYARVHYYSYMHMAVCSSVSDCVCHNRCIVETDERFGLFLVWGLPLTYPTLCCKEIQVPSK